ncbi:MAG: hypothetical protein ACRC1D_01725, partial [Culicoidibacterales bacterium]
MKINKATFDLLPKEMQSAFTVNQSNADEYDNGEEHVSGLKTALEKEKLEKAEYGKKLSEFEALKIAEIEAARKKALEEARSSGDFKIIEDDYKNRLKQMENNFNELKESQNKSLIESEISKAVDELSKIFVAPSFAKEAIRTRLNAEMIDGKVIVRVLDKQKKASSLNIEDLRKEFLTD